MKRRVADVAAIALLIACTWRLYHSILRLWWTMDAPFHLHFLTDHPHLEYLGRSAWRALPFKLFTPLLFLTLDVDLTLAGLAPRAFYVHQLVSLIVAAIACYALLRMWSGPPIAFGGSLLVIAGTPFCTLAQQLDARHYIEGFTFAALSMIAFVLAVRRESVRFEALSAIAYFVAALAKEIYVPLPFIFLATYMRPRRLRMHAIALLIYIALRWLTLGTLGGGYGFAISIRELPVVFANYLKFATLLGGPFPAIAIAATLIVALVIVMRQRPRAAITIAVAFIVAIAPILPVAKAHEPRYALALWLLIAAIIFSASLWRRQAIALLIIACIAALVANREHWRTTYEHSTRMSREGRWFVDADPSALLRNPAIPPAAMGELTWLKPSGAAWTYDDIWFCTHAEPRRVFEYDTSKRAVIEAPARCDDGDERQPLSATFDYRDDVLRWHLGPHETGRYRLILGDGTQAFDVAREDGFQLPGATSLTLRVAHIDERGTRTLSPPLPLDLRRHPAAQWRRAFQ